MCVFPIDNVNASKQLPWERQDGVAPERALGADLVLHCPAEVQALRLVFSLVNMTILELFVSMEADVWRPQRLRGNAVGDAKIWYVRSGVSAIVHGRLLRFYQKHLQNGKPVSPAAVSFITTCALESDTGGSGEVLVLLALSAHVDMVPEDDDCGQDVLVRLLDELLVDDPPPPWYWSGMFSLCRGTACCFQYFSVCWWC